MFLASALKFLTVHISPIFRFLEEMGSELGTYKIEALGSTIWAATLTVNPYWAT